MSDIRVRQVALVGADYERLEAELRGVFGLEVAYRDPGHRPGHEAGVSIFGLRNFVMSVGNQFLEVVSPKPGEDDTAGGRFMARRGGDSGYMLLMQVPRAQYGARAEHVRSCGVRLVAGDEIGTHDSAALHMHPKDLPGVIAEMRWCLDEDNPAGEWWPVERNWPETRRTHIVDAMVGADLHAEDPEAMAARWGEVIQEPVTRAATGGPIIELEGFTIRFVPIPDARGEGLGAIDMRATDKSAALASAEALGVPADGDSVTICGTRFNLV